MLIIGLTGSIGMGKSTVAAYIAARGIPVANSDDMVHRLYAGEAVPAIEAAFPGATAGGMVDRARLSAALLAEQGGFARLEAVIHPLVREAQWRFLRDQENAGAPLALLDIPLLFETGGDAMVDVTMVVSAPAEAQAARVLARPGMTREKLDAILARQIPDTEKRARADFIVDTGLPWEDTRRQVDKLLGELHARRGSAMERWRRKYS